MKKNIAKIDAQKRINFEAIRQYQIAYTEYCNLPYNYESKRLRTCSARVYETEHYYLLRSYNTVVAVINKADRKCYDVLRHVFGFTSTSCQHINKFIEDYSGARYRSEAVVYTFREVEG